MPWGNGLEGSRIQLPTLRCGGLGGRGAGSCGSGRNGRGFGGVDSCRRNFVDGAVAAKLRKRGRGVGAPGLFSTPKRTALAGQEARRGQQLLAIST